MHNVDRDEMQLMMLPDGDDVAADDIDVATADWRAAPLFEAALNAVAMYPTVIAIFLFLPLRK